MWAGVMPRLHRVLEAVLYAADLERRPLHLRSRIGVTRLYP
jgi:hypothetical protein